LDVCRQTLAGRLKPLAVLRFSRPFRDNKPRFLVIKLSKGCLGEEELSALRDVFAYGYFGLGVQVQQFEEALKKYLEADHVVATNTGTSALHLALDALGIGAGDEVIVPSLTFVAAFQAIHATGATPVPCDILSHTLLIDLEDIERRVTRRTKAVMPVHYAGNPCDMNSLMELSHRYGLRIVEDAAHAFGATYKGKKIGGFGDVTCFSFDSIKNITCGEGGAIICRDQALADRMRQKRVLGMNRMAQATAAAAEQKWLSQITTSGFRYHMGNINAAIGLSQLRKADVFVERRRQICRTYDLAFQTGPDLETLQIDYNHAAPHIYVIRVKNGKRDALMQFLHDNGIETGINYPPNHLQPFFSGSLSKLPKTEEAYREIVTLPLHCALTDSDVAHVIGAVKRFFEEAATGVVA
jgi:perosamine synthetase